MLSEKILSLHWQILIGLLLGAVFGIIFKTDYHSINIKYLDDSSAIKSIEISDWDTITLIIEGESEKFSFSNDEVAFIHKTVKRGKIEKKRIDFLVNLDIKQEFIPNIVSTSKVQTIATQIKPIGTLFINLLTLIAIPLVIASLIIGASSLEDVKKLGRLGAKALALYIITSIIAITIGLTLANLIQPGTKVAGETSNRLLIEFQDETPIDISQHFELNILDFIVSIVPKNPISAMANGAMLQIVFFSLIFGLTILFIDKEKAKYVIGFFSGVSEIMIKMVQIIMKIAPIGVFALISATIAEFGYEFLSTLIWYILAVFLGLFIHTLIVYGSLVKFIGKYSIISFFRNIRTAQVIGFTTSSSAATLPITFDCVENKIGVPKSISGFVLPLGATINMDGTALYQGVAAVFIAQVYGLDLTIIEQLTILLTALLASIGTAPVPGVGIIMLVMILESINIPAQGIALILGVDRLLDMARTITNISGDAAVCVSVAGSEGLNLNK